MTYGSPLWGERTWGRGEGLAGVRADAHVIPERVLELPASGLVVIPRSTSLTADAVAVPAVPIFREKLLQVDVSALLIRETLTREVTADAHMGRVVTTDLFASALIWRTDYQQGSHWLGGVQVYGELTERAWFGGDEIFYIWLGDGIRVKADAYIQADHREVTADAMLEEDTGLEVTADGWIKPRPEVLSDAIVIARFGRIHPVPHAGRIHPLPSDARLSRFDPRPK